MKRLRFDEGGHILPLVLGAVVVCILAASGYYIWALQGRLAAGRQHNTATASTTTDQPQAASRPASAARKPDEDLTKLPLGDGKVATSPKQGYVDSCTTNFRGGGAQHAGDWITGSIWNATIKPTVEGSVYWSSAKMDVALSGASRTISGNSLPVKLPTGIFPIQASTAAYQYDRNPNHILSQQVFYALPANPTIVATPSCVPMGVIGYMIDGVALFNALDDGGRDAVAHEIQDSCGGHPQSAGVYHYHGMSSCVAAEDANNTLVGYALDGFGIFSDRDANGNQYTSADLDTCHGITSEIMWDGKMANMYHYVLTHDYPYTIACFRSAPVRTGSGA